MRDLIKEVIEEAESLKVNATKEELNKLNIKNLYPNDRFYCIYGQLSGDCNNSRSIELLTKCAKPYTYRLVEDLDEEDLADASFTELDEEFKYSRLRLFYSPIETYITNPNSKNSTLIKFLKGERKTLRRSDLI